jgi:hypothetical protein
MPPSVVRAAGDIAAEAAGTREPVQPGHTAHVQLFLIDSGPGVHPRALVYPHSSPDHPYHMEV